MIKREKNTKSILSFLRLVFFLLAMTGSSASADEAREACDFVKGRLMDIDGGLHRESDGVFEYDGRLYHGCIVTVVGDSKKGPGNSPPAWRPYPAPGSPAAKAGWNADREADGPDGTSYRISRGNVFCAVQGWWDGGDDSDPKYVPSSLFVITAMCAGKK